ncbi:glycosyltransferase [Pontibacter locisalis]|uniref:Glycosyltransferase n=1 Tax=Pontibacter locisalis TaxID=1719035 RepID=A0ABW5IQD3_9BACT
MRVGITVVICTYNGARLLPETLRYLANQRVRQGIDWEIIVINNASTDNTSEIAVTEWEKYQNNIQLSLYNQPRQGLTFARELGFEKSNFEFVLFCDDDNLLYPDYLNLSYDLMVMRPSIGVLGGYGELLFEVTPPSWAKNYRLFANGPQAETSGKVPNNKVYGAGFIIRKSAYDLLIKAGFKPLLTDRKAEYLSSGGDYEICYAIALAGYDIWYEENLKFKHFMPKERINTKYYKKFVKQSPKSFEVLIPYRIRANNGFDSIILFYLKLIKIFFTYFFMLFPLLREHTRSHPGTARAKLNSLRLASLKYKLLSFRNFFTMRDNFLKIKEFEQVKLQAYKKKNTVVIEKESQALNYKAYQI